MENPLQGARGFSMNWPTRSPKDILHELANAIPEGFDGFGLAPQGPFCFLGGLDNSGLARGFLLDCDHLLVGPGDRVDGRRFPGIPLEQLIPLADQPLGTALAVDLGLLFERCDEPLDRGSGLVGDADDPAVRRFRFLFEAVQAGVGLADDRGDLVLGFENYAFRLVGHFTLL